MPIGSYLIYNIEKEYHSYIKPPDQVDGILILGGATNALLYNEYDHSIENVQETKPLYNEKSHMIDGRLIIKNNFDKLLNQHKNLIIFGEDSEISFGPLKSCNNFSNLFLPTPLIVLKIDLVRSFFLFDF